ncbi:hypothetical protein P7K49_031130 [Saguinus oedipus]|uniref:Uncharacterized protein n=1 Tax=Saguinus oedipus TaxID=9490 RepID=A0ABQ9U457_SAGOE|nr:hypothetical protein P7K49_031130 [Saguinus oedipus]
MVGLLCHDGNSHDAEKQEKIIYPEQRTWKRQGSHITQAYRLTILGSWPLSSHASGTMLKSSFGQLLVVFVCSVSNRIAQCHGLWLSTLSSLDVHKFNETRCGCSDGRGARRLLARRGEGPAPDLYGRLRLFCGLHEDLQGCPSRMTGTEEKLIRDFDEKQ